MNQVSRSPKAAGLILAIMLLLAGLAIFPTDQAKAEENLGEHSFVTEIGGYKYGTYLYPNLNQAFWLPNNFETRFDIHNGKFFKIEYLEWIGPERSLVTPGIRQEPLRCIDLKMTLEFFNPRGERIAPPWDYVRPNWWHAIPHGQTSLEYDRLQVRLRNHSLASRDLRFVVLDPVDPVKGTPTPTRRDIHI